MEERRNDKIKITFFMLMMIGGISEIIMHNLIPSENNLQVPYESEVLIGTIIYAFMYVIVALVSMDRKHPVKACVLASLPCYLLAILMVVNVPSLKNIIKAVLIVITMIIAFVQIKKENEVSQEEGCS